MDAVNFVREYQRLCRDSRCDDCPFRDKRCDPPTGMDAEEIVYIVEKWSKAHPIKTNGDVFKDTFGISVEHLWGMKGGNMIEWMDTEFDKEKS